MNAIHRSREPETVLGRAFSPWRGRVGKSTTAIDLGTALAAMGERVLRIDLDARRRIPDRAWHRSQISRQVTTCWLENARCETSSSGQQCTPIAPRAMDLLGVRLEISGTTTAINCATRFGPMANPRP